MGWLGKVVGGLLGFAAGGPIGAVLGATLGHGVDRGVQKLADDMQLPLGDRKRIESVFFTATFSTMGHLAKADGRVSAAEIALAEAVMARLQLTGERRSAAIALFRQGKAADFDLRAVVERFRRECLGRRTLVQLFLEIQLQAAYVDGEPSAAKRRALEEIREGLRIPQLIFRQLENLVRMQRQSGAGAGRARWRFFTCAGADTRPGLLGAGRQPEGQRRRHQTRLPQAHEPAPPGQASLQGRAGGHDQAGDAKDPGDPPRLRDDSGRAGGVGSGE